MKKLLLALPLLLLSCDIQEDDSNGKSVKKLDATIPDHVTRVKIEMLSEDIDYGLYSATVDDTVHVLIYRGVESVTMIQVK